MTDRWTGVRLAAVCLLYEAGLVAFRGATYPSGLDQTSLRRQRSRPMRVPVLFLVFFLSVSPCSGSSVPTALILVDDACPGARLMPVPEAANRSLSANFA